ncbi:MAG: DUF5906 domain-containing protein [Acidimicrobiia bacterium]|nr:DUF5906 domain-containing protein [Acidimicrobiia bacterium]
MGKKQGVKPDNGAAYDFLRKWQQGGPWILTAITIDRKKIETKTFTEETKEALYTWLTKYNGERNIYFHVNSCLKELTRKAEREDVKSLDWLHVDIDPRAGEDVEEEQKRALSLLQNPPNEVPKPTVIIFSGGGYQGFWKLKDPLPVHGDLAKAEDVKRFNIQLEILFGADQCHNIDRIMRLPGTINLPNAKKVKKGRKKELAALVEFNGNVYDIKTFTPAPLIQTKEDDGFAGNTVKIEGEIPRLVDVHEVDKHADNGPVPDWCKALIVSGQDPNDPHKYPSRSEALFAVCCQLVRNGVDDKVVYSVITDPDFAISESVLEKGRTAERYALRQIEQAKENAVDPFLMKLNQKHAVIGDLGGKCIVVSEVFDHALKRKRLSRQNFSDFRNRYMHKRVQVGITKEGGPVMMPLGKWWLENESRRQFETIAFAPGRELENAYNLWKGFGCEAIAGDCEPFLNHLFENICQEDQENYDYLINWMARAVQKPDCPGETAVVMRGKRGTGKSFFVKVFGSLWGRHFLAVSDPKHLVGSFNAHLRDCVILFGDEAFFAGDKKHESVLKMLITEELITFEAKGVDAEPGPNYTHLLLASNSDWVVPAGTDERRFFVVDVSEKRRQDSDYFRAINQHMFEQGGRQALLHMLLNHDLNGFNVRKAPATDALREQKELSFAPEIQWFYECLQRGRLCNNHKNWEDWVLTQDVYIDCIENAKLAGINRRSYQTTLGRMFKKHVPRGSVYPLKKMRSYKREIPDPEFPGTIKVVGQRDFFYKFPPLNECRAFFSEVCNAKFEWQSIELHDDDLPLDNNGKEPF